MQYDVPFRGDTSTPPPVVDDEDPLDPNFDDDEEDEDPRPTTPAELAARDAYASTSARASSSLCNPMTTISGVTREAPGARIDGRHVATRPM